MKKNSTMTDSTPSPTFGPAHAADRPALERGLALAFGFDPARAAEYVEAVGVEAFRAVRIAGEIAASAAMLRTAHHFGGEPVEAINVAHVAVAPAHRGGGVARLLLAGMETEALASGAAMATLFASARPVYRRLGYELAGHEIVYEVETAALPARPTARFVEIEAAPDRLAAVADRAAGTLRRAPAHWRELFRAPRHALAVFAIDADPARGWLLLDAADSGCLVVRDWQAPTGAAAAAILGFLGTFRSVYPRVLWHGGPACPLIFALPDKGWRVHHQEEWLAKLLDPTGALIGRGYECADAAVDLVLRRGGGETALGLAVESGRGRIVEAGSAPRVVLDEPDFAMMYTGFRSAGFLRRAGRVVADDAATTLCDRIFAGPAPWIGEHV